ncbi:GTPase Era, mitochondrial [Denticeps clupeoides]|uniref:GTPase Era, mitochondrial n=1 Tax=Denticeps clupeoides TaxID=299321 RepID=UPI0010A48658|nr:GTPase Era, mitochondrial [Denticeps clupeoides]
MALLRTPLRLAATLFRRPGPSVRRLRLVSARILESSRGPAVHLAPVCFISSEAILDRLLRGKDTETSDGPRPASVPPDRAQQLSLLLKHPDQPEKPKVLKVAVIGAPNAGKSTLSNQLLGRKVFAVSKKVHTTRARALGVWTAGDTQIILLDTPGFTTPAKVKRHHLEKSLLVDPSDSVQEADLVVVLVDVSEKWSRGQLDFEVLKCLARHPHIPAVLVLNKVDLLKNKSLLLDVTAELTDGVVNGKKLRVRSVVKPGEERKGPTPAAPPPRTEAQGPLELSREDVRELRTRRGWPRFKDVFMLSSLDEEDVETLKSYLLVGAKPGPWLYHSDVLTDQSPEDICVNTIRGKLLENLPEEVPYTMTQCIEVWRESESSLLDVAVKLYVKKDSHMRMVIGQGGQLIAKIAHEAAEDLSRIFNKEVKLKISAKLKN